MPNEKILIGETVYIVGHKKPDLDAIVAVYAYQVYRHSQGDFNYLAIRCDEVNPVTDWVFKETKYELPRLISDVSGLRLVLVDHTDPEQRADGWENAEIIEVVDHHKLKLETSAPAKITVRPYGSSTTLVAEKLMKNEVTLEPRFALLMLSAILDDTLALRSPITTHIDKTVAGQLAAISGVGDVDAYARRMFEQKDVWHKMSAEEIVEKDVKDFEMGETKIRISQVESINGSKLTKKIPDIQKYINKQTQQKDIDLFIVMLTNIISNQAVLIVDGTKANDLSEIFSVPFEDGVLTLPGVVSRKKQMIPPLMNFYNRA